MIKDRQTNIELCRLISIIMVMLLHTTWQSLGPEMNFWAYFLEGFTIIGVNVFVLITGYFSASPKKSSLINLVFICLFWGIIRVICRFVYDAPVTYQYLFFVTKSNWFIASYIGLLLFAPILNLFCSTVNKRVLWGGVIILLLYELWFDWMPPYPETRIGAKNGYSVLSFIILYLLARAVKLYGLPQQFSKWSFFIYTGCSLMIALVAQVTENQRLCFAYNNPLVILSSLAFLMMFKGMNLQSKLINHLAKSTLGVLLGHSAIFFLYTKQFKYLYDHFSGIMVVAYWTLAIAIVFSASIAIDQIRLLLYKPIEKMIKVKIKTNNIFDFPKANQSM